jgi:HK97 gp10 family phage protein
MINFDASDLERAVAATIDQVIGSIDEPALRAVGFAGAEIFRDEAKRNAQSHAKTWTIWRNIIVKRLEEESDGAHRQVYLVTVRKGEYGGDDAFYWRFVEYGHKFVPKNKNISAKSGKKFGWKAHRAAAELEYGTATVPAYPYMRPAYESRKTGAIDAMTKKLQEQLERNRSQ